MFKPYTIDVGKFLIKLARKAVESYLTRGIIITPPEDTPKQLLQDNYGVFTTIEIIRDNETELRGCIGYPKGYQNVATATIRSAIAAATEDPRFEPLRVEELNHVVFEISILGPITELKVSKPREYLEKIIIGRHGLIIQKNFFSGLLLPQVPVEFCWDVITFLNETCVKALLLPNCWVDLEHTKLMIYEAQVFKELSPNGDVIERDLVKEYREKCEGKS